MSFAAIDPKLFFMINNYASYDEQAFGARYVAYEVGKLRESKFSVLPFFPLFPLSTPSLPY